MSPLESTVENFSFLVSVLSAIASVLITWQIFTLFNIRKVEKSVSALRDKTILEVNTQMNILSNAQSLMFIILAEESKSRDFYGNYLMFSLHSIHYSSKCGDYDSCNSRVDGLIDVLSSGKITVDKDTAEQAIEFLLTIDDRSQISRFRELLRVLHGFL